MEKTCKNPRCHKIVTNPRRQYCSDGCRENAAYWRRVKTSGSGVGRGSGAQERRLVRAARTARKRPWGCMPM